MILRWARNRRIKLWNQHLYWLIAERGDLPASLYRDWLDKEILATERRIMDLRE